MQRHFWGRFSDTSKRTYWTCAPNIGHVKRTIEHFLDPISLILGQLSGENQPSQPFVITDAWMDGRTLLNRPRTLLNRALCVESTVKTEQL